MTDLPHKLGDKMDINELSEIIKNYAESIPGLTLSDGKFTTEDGRQYYWKIERKEVKG